MDVIRLAEVLPPPPPGPRKTVSDADAFLKVQGTAKTVEAGLVTLRSAWPWIARELLTTPDDTTDDST